MRIPKECYQMQRVIETHLPHLTQPQLTGLAWWVCGTILAGSACRNAVASALSIRGNWNNLRQYLREWLYDGGDRARPCKTELDVSLCFAPLLRWVLAWWRSGRLALAVDPTLKGDDTTAIVISVVYRGCAIPVAWRIHRATQRGSWMDPTVELLKELAPAVPRDMTVIVLCDRGISSPKLWQQIRAQGWHPYMRYRKNITFCAEGGRRLPARAFVSRPDTAWGGSGTAFGAAAAKRLPGAHDDPGGAAGGPGLGEVKKVLADPAVIVAGIESLGEKGEDGLNEETVRAERELEKVQLEEDRAIRLYVSGKITESQLDHQRKFITERQESLREKLNDCRARESAQVEQRMLAERVVEWAERIGDGVDDLPDDKRREVLRLLLDEVTIDGENNVNLTLAIPTEDLVPIEPPVSA